MTTQTSQPATQSKKTVLAVGRLGSKGLVCTQAQVNVVTSRLQKGTVVKNVVIKKEQTQE